jgi:two-component system sensor histidine kinase KdpD
MSSAYLSDACRAILRRREGPWRYGRLARRLALVACSIAAPVAAGMAAGHSAASPIMALWFAPPIFLIALWGGLAPASLTILVALIAFDYWVLPPQRSFSLTQASDLWMAIGLLPCAAIASFLGARLRRQLRTIHRLETRGEALRLLSHAVVSQGSPEAVYFAAANALSRTYAAKAVVLIVTGGRLELASGSRGATVNEGDLDAANWALANNAPAGLGCEASVGSRYDFWPLTTPTLSAVLGVERKAGGSEDGLRDGVVELVAGYLLACVRRPLYVVR